MAKQTHPSPRSGGRRGGAPADPKAEWAKQGRLWLLSLICATAGAVTVYLTNSLPIGIGVFALVLVVLGPLLYLFEKARAKRRRP